MLVGLRERYHRTFLAWNSSFANLGRFLGLLILIILTGLVGRLFPEPERPPCMPKGSYQINFFGPLFDYKPGAMDGKDCEPGGANSDAGKSSKSAGKKSPSKT